MPIFTDQRFQVVRRIGRTPFSQSYEVVHPFRPGRFLLEVLVGLRHHADARAAFEWEVETVASLQHPYLLQTLGISALPDGTPIAVSELPDGKTLHAWLSEGHVASPEETSELITALGEALLAAHGVGVSHGDVTAENVFLVKDPGGAMGLPKLSGFGWRWVPAAHVLTSDDITQNADARAADVEGLAHLAERLLNSAMPADDPIIASFFVGSATREVLTRGRASGFTRPFVSPAAFASALATAIAGDQALERDVA